MAQQLIAHGHTQEVSFHPAKWPNAWRISQSLLEALIHWVLWLVHGCPPSLNTLKTFTMADLSEACGQAGWPLFAVDNLADRKVLDFTQQHAELVVALDPVLPAPFVLSRRGLVRVFRGALDDAGHSQDIQIRIEHFSKEAQTPCVIAALAVPLQQHDGLLGLTLKTDLMADDLLVQTVKGLNRSPAQQAGEEVREWMERMYSPYLAQLQQGSVEPKRRLGTPQRHRRQWKLGLDTLLLCSTALVRNWWDRWRGRYPVLILTHHLVADRPHRMSLPTEQFWRQVRFLQRHYRVASLADAVELLRSGKIAVPTVALTFDDGYADNFISLRAVAEETGIPVTLFIVAQPIELHREFQHDLDRGIKGFLPLTWDQVRFWQTSGAEFGSHTRTHSDCGTVDSTVLKAEIVGSKNDLEERLSSPIKFFAFPFGGPQNMSPQAVQMAASAYPYFVSGFGGENRPPMAGNTSHLYRKNLYASLWELELELQSVFDLVDRWRGRLLRPLSSAASIKAPAAALSASSDITAISRAGD
jgi:peptidoglycan/xylan/chitin deacetylase (PgdA/CDA1 family)